MTFLEAFKTLSQLEHFSVAMRCCKRFLSLSLFFSFSLLQVLNFETFLNYHIELQSIHDTVCQYCHLILSRYVSLNHMMLLIHFQDYPVLH